MTEPQETRAAYPHFLAIATRWHDNDIYGHVNNVVYYSYFDTVVNDYLVRAGGLDIHHDAVIGITVESQCQYHRSLCFPETIAAGLRVAKLGQTSVRYEIGIFQPGQERPAATGHFVHVFVERGAQRPVPIPDNIRVALERIQIAR
ncbi:MAG: thioesterase family protein [Burkholderiales bacterium]